MFNLHWSLFNCHSKPGVPIAFRLQMDQNRSQSDQLEDRLIEFAARIVRFSSELYRTPAGRHIASQILRSGTAGAANYAEARGAESRADFIHKLAIVQKELNETSVWLRVLAKISREKDGLIVTLLVENVELARIITASIRTAKSRGQAGATRDN
jgi:four helix bundle protein